MTSAPQVRVSRSRIVSCARKIIEQLGYVSAMVEIEFYGEVGTGLGPTLEFYSILALELQSASLKMWRCPATLTRVELFPDGAVLLDARGARLIDSAGLGQAPGFGSEPDGGVDDAVSDEFVLAPRGLFPAPVMPDSAACAAASDNFLFLGKLLARCMMDGRLFDLPLSPLVYKVLICLFPPFSCAAFCV
jgi:E3 ubiquitin-protein ligase TRIP12